MQARVLISLLLFLVASALASAGDMTAPEKLKLENGDEIDVEVDKMVGNSVHFFNLVSGDLEVLELKQLTADTRLKLIEWATQDLIEKGELKINVRYTAIREMRQGRELARYDIVVDNQSAFTFPEAFQISTKIYRFSFDLEDQGDGMHAYKLSSLNGSRGPISDKQLFAESVLTMETRNQISTMPPFNWIRLFGEPFELNRNDDTPSNVYLSAVQLKIIYEGKTLYEQITPNRTREYIEAKQGDIKETDEEVFEADDEPETKDRIAGASRPQPTPEAETKSKVISKAPDISYGSIVIIQSDKGSGTGFLMEMKGRTFMVTNSHVVTGADYLTAKTSNGHELYLPRAFFACKDRDLALFPINHEGEYLKLPENFDDVKIGDAVTVYGNEAGASVVTQLSGEVNGVGPVRVEIDARFVEGNSGSPVIHHDTEGVIGLATYYIEYNTPEADRDAGDYFERKSNSKKTRRRFAERIDNASEWQSVNLPMLKKEKEALDEYEDFLNGVYLIARGITENSRVISPSQGTRGVEDILEDFHDSFHGGYHGNKRAVDDLKKRLITHLEARRSLVEKEVTTYFLVEELNRLGSKSRWLKEYVEGVYYR